MIYEAEELWSPSMRKWARFSRKHGPKLKLATLGQDRWEGAGIPQNLARYTDDGGLRVLDSPIGILNTSQPRTIDYPTNVRGPTPALVVPTAAGVTFQQNKVGIETLIRYLGSGGKI